jgi:hypothetical protein
MAALLGEQRSGAIKTQLVGRKLKDICDRVVDGLVITSRYDSHRKQHLWYLQKLQENNGNGDASIFE